MSDHQPARTWRRLRATLARIVAPLTGRARRTLAISLPATPTHSHERQSPMTDHARPPGHQSPATTADTYRAALPATPDPVMTAGRTRTSNRHTRHADDDWRAAATRAARDGRKVSDVVRELVAAYGAGTLNLPATRPHPDAWACLACRSEETRRGATWLQAPCPDHQPTTTSTPTTEE